jgi:hypothetical protein
MDMNVTDHPYGPKGVIVDAFIKHLREMTDRDWREVRHKQLVESHGTLYATKGPYWSSLAALKARAEWYKIKMDDVRDAAQDAIKAEGYPIFEAGYAAENYAGLRGWGATDAVRAAANEIQGANLLRERGQPFFFLPMFGFADERAVIDRLGG